MREASCYINLFESYKKTKRATIEECKYIHKLDIRNFKKNERRENLQNFSKDKKIKTIISFM